jgi:ABC-type iron transport system FetAB permease component
MRETGYWLPHAPISYLLIVLSAVVVWFVARYIFRIESDTVVLLSITVLPVLIGFWANRYTKMAWLMLDLWLHPASQDDFEARGRN